MSAIDCYRLDKPRRGITACVGQFTIVSRLCLSLVSKLLKRAKHNCLYTSPRRVAVVSSLIINPLPLPVGFTPPLLTFCLTSQAAGLFPDSLATATYSVTCGAHYTESFHAVNRLFLSPSLQCLIYSQVMPLHFNV